MQQHVLWGLGGMAAGAAITALVSGQLPAGTMAALAQAPAAAPAAAPQVAAVPLPAGCDRPAYLLVTVDNLDRTKSKPYGEALFKSKIVRRHGGTYLAVGAPGKVLEGTWPAERSLVLEKYPCKEMIETFWYSDEYQKDIKPLREGSGTYNVAVYEEYRPAPPATQAPAK